MNSVMCVDLADEVSHCGKFYIRSSKFGDLNRYIRRGKSRTVKQIAYVVSV